MKLHKILIPALMLGCGAMLTTSCNDYLREKPESFIGPDNIESSKTGVDTWVTGVYSNWLYDMFCWDEFPRVLELDADYISGPDWLFGSMGAGNFQAESALDKMWNGPYNLINDANTAIRYISGMTNVDEAYRNNAIGEMYFQEAFCYFLLVRAYGPIPYMAGDVSSTGQYNNSRRPVAEIYDHIIDLLTKASEMMYRRDDANYKAGHVSAGSAAGLLAKVYATMASAAMPAGTEITVKTGAPYRTVKNTNGDDINVYRAPSAEVFHKKAVAGYENMDSHELYQKAAEWAKKVIDGDYGLYTLTSYDNLWKYSHHTDSEMMWGIESTAGDNTYRTGIHAYYEGTEDGSGILTTGGYIGCTNNWYSLFDDDDYRITKGVKHVWRYYYQTSYNGAFYYPQSWSVKVTGRDPQGNYVQEPEKQFSDLGYAYQYNTSSECLAFTTKYSDVSDPTQAYPESFWPFLRYADVLLIYAEAENELGNMSEAMTYLNMVRQRSNAKLMENPVNQENMRSQIIEERAKEFACEADRRWDLIRWGIYLDAMNAIGRDDSNINKARTERNLLYPIPTAEINVNDSINSNNPGWN